ncbi:MAG: ROK family transcriptional regulator, partial [Alphaproteobacteria bacterium]
MGNLLMERLGPDTPPDRAGAEGSESIRRANRLRLVSALRRLGPMSRIEAARHCGLSPATITLIAAELQRAGILVEGERTERGTGPGRPRRRLGLAPGRAEVAAAAVTHRGIGFARADFALSRIERWQTRPELGTMDTRELAEHVVAAFDRKPDVLVLGVQGAVANDGRSIVWSPALPGASGALAGAIEARGFPYVTVDNDCALIAGILPREIEGLNPPFCAVLASYGIGAAVVGAEGIMRGARSSAFELGHVPYRPDGRKCRCGRRGCVEAYAADYAV